MTEFEKIIITAGLAYAGSLLSVLVGYWFNCSAATRKARRDHKTQLRLIHASCQEGIFNKMPSKSLNEWWLRAIDDCGWIKRYRIERCVSEFRLLELPPPYGAMKEGGHSKEQAAINAREFDAVLQRGIKILDRVLSYL